MDCMDKIETVREQLSREVRGPDDEPWTDEDFEGLTVREAFECGVAEGRRGLARELFRRLFACVIW